MLQEYLELEHAELVPHDDLSKPEYNVFYLPMHVVYKNSSTTTKVRAVFDASAKSTTGISLNDCLVVGPTIHAPLIDVLLRFRLHRIAITTDISKMYRAIGLIESDRDLHQFVWRSHPSGNIQDYRMTRVTFGVSASSFVANMCVKRNSIDFGNEVPLAAQAVSKSFYVDDGLTGADDIPTTIILQKQLQDLFARGGFMLHKWNSNEPNVLKHIDPSLRDIRDTQEISDKNDSTKTLGIEWITSSDEFRLTVSQSTTPQEVLTKRTLISDIARVFDALGWFSPTTITVKILLQRFWERNIGWDDPAPTDIVQIWQRWRTELPLLLNKKIPRCYFPKNSRIISKQLHGFSDASEEAYSAVTYLRMLDSLGDIHISIVASKTRVSPIKRQSIPRLELCGALLLARLIDHTKEVLEIPLVDTYAWTDSTIVLSWLSGNPRRFKTFVGNRVSLIIDLIPPERWKHVIGTQNPADCASRGVFPSELLDHHLWWSGPEWLKLTSNKWPLQSKLSSDWSCPESVVEICHIATTGTLPLKPSLVLSPDRYSSYQQTRRVIKWIIRFVNNCRPQKFKRCTTNYLSTPELHLAEVHIYSIIQAHHFSVEIDHLKSNKPLPKGNCLLPFSPFIDCGLIRVGGRQRHSLLPYSRKHPIILHGNHAVTKQLILFEHKRLLHAGVTLVISSLNHRFHIIRIRTVARSITRQSVTCCRHSARPIPPMLGQLPIERLTPGAIFDKTGLDYAGPIYIKYGHVRKPVIVKSYVCVFVSLNVKAVHLELVSDLTSEAFLSCLRRFISRRGYPSLLWSDHGTNFVGANREIKELIDHLKTQKTQQNVSDFCNAHNIQWKFIPEHSPHFGGIWEASVKSFKKHLRRVVGEVKLTFQEMHTVLSQIEACLNSRPFVPVNHPDDDGIETLTPGHFLICQPLMALPDPAISYQSISLLRRWHLCQSLVRHFWKRWSLEYLSTLQRISKWQRPVHNVAVGDVVVLIEDGMVPTQWPLARILKTYPGTDGVIRVVDIKTSKGLYRRPVHKIAVLPCGSD